MFIRSRWRLRGDSDSMTSTYIMCLRLVPKLRRYTCVIDAHMRIGQQTNNTAYVDIMYKRTLLDVTSVHWKQTVALARIEELWSRVTESFRENVWTEKHFIFYFVIMPSIRQKLRCCTSDHWKIIRSPRQSHRSGLRLGHCGDREWRTGHRIASQRWQRSVEFPSGHRSRRAGRHQFNYGRNGNSNLDIQYDQPLLILRSRNYWKNINTRAKFTRWSQVTDTSWSCTE